MQQIDDIIWKTRNTKVKSWERSLSITKNKKWFYHQHHRKCNSDPSTDHPIDAPPRRSYTHRRFTIIPYFREGGFYDNDTHIRWTSSNFLHSGYWHKHRDNFWFNNIDLFSFLRNTFLGSMMGFN
ncbi:unnamed protein product [Rhizophagus irregularis]|nr:unnamed protein product [Rhizophagus irregularis]